VAAGSSEMLGKTGAFIAITALSGWLANGSGVAISESVCISESGQPSARNRNDASPLAEAWRTPVLS